MKGNMNMHKEMAMGKNVKKYAHGGMCEGEGEMKDKMAYGGKVGKKNLKKGGKK